MKKILVILALVLTAFVFTANAQKKEKAAKTPQWLSEKGYWVLEDNVNGNSFTVIHFYNNDNQLIYKEKLIGVSLNIRKKKTLMKLKDALETAIVAWEDKHQVGEDEAIVASILH